MTTMTVGEGQTTVTADPAGVMAVQVGAMAALAMATEHLVMATGLRVGGTVRPATDTVVRVTAMGDLGTGHPRTRYRSPGVLSDCIERFSYARTKNADVAVPLSRRLDSTTMPSHDRAGGLGAWCNATK